MSIGSRIKELRTANHLTQVEFASRLRISKGFLSNIEKDIRHPSDQLIRLIAYEFSSSEDWLTEGKGDMLMAPEEIIKKQISHFGSDQFIQAFLKILNENNSVIPLGSLSSYNNGKISDPELARMIRCLESIWSLEDQKLKDWAQVQFERAFPRDMQEEIQKKSAGRQGQISG